METSDASPEAYPEAGGVSDGAMTAGERMETGDDASTEAGASNGATVDEKMETRDNASREAGAAGGATAGSGGDVELGNVVGYGPRFKDQVKSFTREQQQEKTRELSATTPPASTTSAPAQTTSLPLVSTVAVAVEEGGYKRRQSVFQIKRYKLYWALSILITAAIIIGSFCGAGHCPDSSSMAANTTTKPTVLESTSHSTTASPAPYTQTPPTLGWFLGLRGETCNATCTAAGGVCNAAGNEQVDDATKILFVAEDILSLICATTSSGGSGAPSFRPYNGRCNYQPDTHDCSYYSSAYRSMCCCSADLAACPVSD